MGATKAKHFFNVRKKVPKKKKKIAASLMKYNCIFGLKQLLSQADFLTPQLVPKNLSLFAKKVNNLMSLIWLMDAGLFLEYSAFFSRKKINVDDKFEQVVLTG